MFKPGYCPWPDGFYIESCKGKINVTGDKEKRIGEGGTLELPKLTKREDRWKAEGISPDSFFEIMADKQKVRKIKNFLRLMNEERRFLGLGENPVWKEIENER